MQHVLSSPQILPQFLIVVPLCFFRLFDVLLIPRLLFVPQIPKATLVLAKSGTRTKAEDLCLDSTGGNKKRKLRAVP